MDFSEIHINDYDYNLPESKIAYKAVTPRDTSKLLVRENNKIYDDNFYNVHNWLPENTMLILNNTKVLQSRLRFKKPTGAEIEVFCLSPYPEEITFDEVLVQTGSGSWKCFVGNARRWKQEDLKAKILVQNSEVEVVARMGERIGDAFLIHFSWNSSTITFADILSAFGDIPLPPYIKRQTVKEDKYTYQTVYAQSLGSVAAPTAGLHFTDEVFERLKNKNIIPTYVTLHVGAGTFKPVGEQGVGKHIMHSEYIEVPIDVIRAIIENDTSITAVGTTTVRTLESVYWQGVYWICNEVKNPLMNVNQWMPYELPDNVSVKESLSKVIEVLEKYNLKSLKGYTSLMIVPGYKYRIIKRLITNFHQPKSTLLLLVSAFIGDGWKDVYNHALANDYRFLSYGDACLFTNQSK
ncbi:MAG: S-adenosylmethionine:tRNA ribosyltransferase-isomerase [Lentimicrobiaceae bacterium]|nr:S-adenosylmethionine:tRNA ribosyltransferase-isomerase [Lentimicrobiaceae bacterium]